MIKEKWCSLLLFGVISWHGVFLGYVINITKYQGHWNFLGVCLFEEPKMVLNWAYKGSDLNIAQMGFAPKDEMQEMPKYSYHEFIRIIGGS